MDGVRDNMEENKYCPNCGNKTEKKWYDRVVKILNIVCVIFLMAVGSVGVLFLINVYKDSSLVSVVVNRMDSFEYTKLSHVYNPEVQKTADNIMSYCKSVVCEDDNCTYSEYYSLNECQVSETRKYMVDTFTWINDWESGEDDRAYNMITEHRKNGDCEDFTITFCNVLFHMGVGCRPVVVSTGKFSSHVIAFVEVNDRWELIDPQSRYGEWYGDNDFGGYVV